MHYLQLRQKVRGSNWTSMHCRIDERGYFVLEGQDLTASSEYEWMRTVTKRSLPRLCALFDVSNVDELFEIIARDYLPVEGDGLERFIRTSSVPSRFVNYYRFD
jgi:hypothetical protein